MDGYVQDSYSRGRPSTNYSSSNIDYNFEYTIGFQTALSMEGRLLATDMKSILYPCFCVVNAAGVVVT